MTTQKKYDGKLLERRFEANITLPQEEEQGKENIGVLEGIPIVFNQPTILRDFMGNEMEEVILPTAIQDGAITRDCALFYNHDDSKKPLARIRTGRLHLEQRADGVYMRAELNLERQDCKDLYLAIKDGEINKMSFAFRMDDFEIDFSGDIPRRTITKISYIYEVSAVSEPAYKQTSISARNAESVETEDASVETVTKAYMEYKDEERKKELELEKAKTLALLKFQ